MTFTPLPRALVLALACTLAAGPALAQKPEHAGGPKPPKQQEREGVQPKLEDNVGQGTRMGRKALQPGAYFNDQHRDAVRSYYAQQHGGKKGCPPGLAKKNNGCMPPGQARKWQIGQPLPPEVVLHPLPKTVLVKLPPQPPGYRYVRVASDILLIAIGSKMVVDGITDLMRL